MGFHGQWTWVRSLVGKLRSHKPCGAAKKKKKDVPVSTDIFSLVDDVWWLKTHMEINSFLMMTFQTIWNTVEELFLVWTSPQCSNLYHPWGRLSLHKADPWPHSQHSHFYETLEPSTPMLLITEIDSILSIACLAFFHYSVQTQRIKILFYADDVHF